MPANPDREGGFPGAEAKPFVLERILQLRVLRKSAKDIADTLTREEGYPISWTSVQRMIREAAEECRARHRELADQRFLEQDRTLEVLLGQVMQAMEQAATAGQPPDDKLIRAAVALADRQARLHGLDKARTGGAVKHDWLDGLSRADLMRTAELYGIKVPEPLRLTLTPGAAVEN
jgi:hypothetical protein